MSHVKTRDVTAHVTDVVEGTPIKDTSVMATAVDAVAGSDSRTPGGIAPIEMIGTSCVCMHGKT
jgi:hypothetical protein